MTVIDTFVTQFKVDDAELKKGYDDLKKSNDKMEMSLEQIEKKAEMTADKLFALGKKVVGFIGTAIIANKTIGEAIAEAKEITRLDEFASSVDSTIEDVNALNNTITSLGGDKAVAEANVNSLFSSIQNAVKDANSETAKSFKNLGVSIKDSQGQMRDLFETMGDVSQAVSRMDDRKAKEFLKALGITDRATIELMMKGREEFNQMIRAQKAASPVNAESAKKSVEFTKALGALSVEFGNMKQSIGIVAIPILTYLLQKLSLTANWMKENKPFVIGFFSAIAFGITWMYLPAMTKAVTATWALVAPVMAAATPFILLAAALGLAVSEGYAFLNGHDNLISRLLASNPTLKKWSDTFSMYVGDAVDYAKADWQAAQNDFSLYINDGIFGTIDKVKNWKDQFSTVVGDWADSLKSSFESVKNTYDQYITPIIDSVNTSVLDYAFKSSDKQNEDNSVIKIGPDGKSTQYVDGAGNLHDKSLMPTDEPRIPENNELSFLNPESMQKLGRASQEVKDTLNSPLMQDKNGLMQNIAMTKSSTSESRKEVRIDNIEIKLPAGDVASMAQNLEQAINKVLGEQFDDVIVQSSTSLV